MGWLTARLSEPSTWAGVGLIAGALAAFDMAFAGAIAQGFPHVALIVTAAGMGLGGLAAFATKEEKALQPPATKMVILPSDIPPPAKPEAH